MSSIKTIGIETLAEWAERNEDKNVFPLISKSLSTYYVNRDLGRPYMIDFSFQNIEELKALLEQYSELKMDTELLRMISIAICQNRYQSAIEFADDQQVGAKDDHMKKLPEYLYVF